MIRCLMFIAVQYICSYDKGRIQVELRQITSADQITNPAAIRHPTVEAALPEIKG